MSYLITSSKLTLSFHLFLRREILFDYEQYEYHGTSVSRGFTNVLSFFSLLNFHKTVLQSIHI